jgi:colanic acid/amylovoran biosynthesis glycosyltransferase
VPPDPDGGVTEGGARGFGPDASRLRVLHSALCWLPITETWLHAQVDGLPEWVESRVVCDERINADLFPGQIVHAAADEGRARMLWTRLLRRTGLRRHLGLLERVAAEMRPHVLHSHFGDVGWRNMTLARRRSLPHVVSFYGSDATALPREARWRHRYRRLLASASLILCEGPHMAGTLEAIGCPATALRVHRLGVDLGRLPYRPRVRPDGRPLRVLMAGSFREKKGLPYAVDALGLLVRDGVDVEATLIGGGRDAEGRREGARVAAAAARHGITGRIRMLGYVPHARLMEEAEAHDVFLAPSVTAANGDAEGGAPVAVIEMAATGMPVVSTLHCDIPFVLGEPNRRLLAPERDPEALAAAVRELLRMPWESLTRANRALVEREMDGRTQARRLAAHYADLTAGRAVPAGA